MIIGGILNPREHPDWPKIEAFLEPSAKYGNVEILPPDHVVWAVYDGLVLKGCATARLTVDGIGEVVLIGGERPQDWLGELDEHIAAWMRDEGMEKVRAFGRKGWGRLAKEWTVLGQDGTTTVYERPL